jgi:TP901-1 family phage major tail protein
MFIDGSYRVLYIDSGSGFFPVGCLTSHSFSEESETIDTTTRDNAGWNTTKATNQSYSISFSGLVLENQNTVGKQTYNDLKSIKRNRTLIKWRVDQSESGEGIITSLSDSNEMEESVSFDAELIGYGKPFIGILVEDGYGNIIEDGYGNLLIAT